MPSRLTQWVNTQIPQVLALHVAHNVINVQDQALQIVTHVSQAIISSIQEQHAQVYLVLTATYHNTHVQPANACPDALQNIITHKPKLP